MGIVSWLFFGLIAGIIAKLLTPGADARGCFVTIAIGIAGAAIGGFIGAQLGWGGINGFDFRSLGMAVLGSVLLLLVLRAINRPALPG